MLLFIRWVSLALFLALFIGLVISMVLLARRANQPKKKKRTSVEDDVRQLLIADRYEDALDLYQKANDVAMDEALLAVDAIAETLEADSAEDEMMIEHRE